MGQESFRFAGFGTDRLRHEQAMKTTVEEPQIAGRTRPATEYRAPGRSEEILLKQVGFESRKFQPREKFFFLTFPLIYTFAKARL
jgi:hypothetical protein